MRNVNKIAGLNSKLKELLEKGIDLYAEEKRAKFVGHKKAIITYEGLRRENELQQKMVIREMVEAAKQIKIDLGVDGPPY